VRVADIQAPRKPLAATPTSTPKESPERGPDVWIWSAGCGSAEAAEDNCRTPSGSWRITVPAKKSPTDRRFLLVSQHRNGAESAEEDAAAVRRSLGR
jgi:hypothetical protein